MHYEQNPTKITEDSFTQIRRELNERNITSDEEHAPIIERMIHSTADFDFASITHFSAGAVQSGINALRSGCTIVTDVNMIRIGISVPRVEALNCSLHCLVADPQTRQRATLEKSTRSAMGMRIAHEWELLDGGIIVIGNAPTALYEMLTLIDEQNAKPALIIGVPVGFVNVVESKNALMQTSTVPWIATKGRKGGSPIAVATVNALLRMAQGVARTQTD